MRHGAALGPGAALAAFVAVLVALNVTADPIVCASAFVALATLAIASGHRRLVVLAVLVGCGLALVIPGVSIADGSFRLAFVDAGLPDGRAQWAATLGVALRVPAQVLAAVFLLLVPARLLLAGAARASPRTALLGALAARMQPLLGRDVAQLRDTLESRGLRIGRGAPIGERANAIRALWEGAVAGLLDRAFVTAAALDARGWGVATPMSDELHDPRLRDGPSRDRAVDAVMIACACATVALVVALHARGLLQSPGIGLVVHGDVAPTMGAMSVAALLATLALLPIARRRDERASSGPGVANGMARSSGVVDSLVVAHASMQYPHASKLALEHASLVVAPGELVVLTGPSGGGKSTLLDVVSGVAPRTTGGVRSGEVRLGSHVLGVHRAHGEPQRVAAVFQLPEAQVLVGMVAEEVAFGPRYAGLARGEVERRVVESLELMGALHLARRDCSTLSGGELQRVLLAAALALDPAVLVLDEPTSQLDHAGEQRFWSVVDRVRRERRVAVLVAEHRLDALLVRADAIVQVEHGLVGERVSPAASGGVIDGMVSDPYRGLVPAPPIPNAAIARLAIRCDRLEAGDRTLLRSLAVSLPPGSIVTLEGPNGTGKSTLLRAIRGLHPGVQVHVDGVPCDGVGASARLLAWQAQGAGAMLPGRSVFAAASETSLRVGLGDAHVAEALAAAGLADRADAHPTELSVGERQRLALIASTAHRPAVWLIDEPTRGMDAAARRWVAQYVLAHAASGGVVVIATHDAQLAAAVATHRLRLDARTGPSLIGVERSHGTPIEHSPGNAFVDDEAQWSEVQP